MFRFTYNPVVDMDLDDLRVALFNHIVSRQKNKNLSVRIEDMDKEKNTENKDQEVLEILSLFGIKYSQVVYQSQNIRFYSAMALQLIHEKKAFSCFCSDEWLKNKKKEAQEAQKTYRYDGACENLPAELVIDNPNPFTIRIKQPSNNITIKDYINGEITFKPDDMDSFIIMKQDKTPVYDFACAIDDMLSDISIVICDKDYINNAPKQEYIRESLGYNKKIEYAHIPKIPNGNTINIKALLEDGYLPEAISNYLILMGSDIPKEIFTLEEATKWFDLSSISKSPTRFDINTLRKINKEHLKNLDSKELSRYVGFADEEIGELAKIYLEDAQTTKELRSKIEPIFAPKVIPQELQEQTDLMHEIIKQAPYLDKYNDFKNYIMENSELKDENFSKLLRLLLTGVEDGPDIEKIYKYIKNYIGEIIK